MSIAHFGVGLFAIGASGVESYKIEKDVALKPGGSFDIAGLRFQVRERGQCARTELRCGAGHGEVTRGGKPVTMLLPQKRHFWVQQTSNSKAAISVNWARDLFVAMGDPLGANAWSMRIQYKPLVRYIWLGAIVMALGGLIAATDRRYRVKVRGRFAPKLPSAPNLARGTRLRLMWKFLLPFAAFVALVVLFAFGLNPKRDIHALPSPLIGKSAPQFALTDVLDPARTVSNAELQGAGLRAECLGHLVRGLPRGTRSAALDRTAACGPDHRARLPGQSREGKAVAATTRQPLYRRGLR